MELLYYYSESEKYIDTKGINLGGKYTFELFKKNGYYILNYRKNPNYIMNFYSNNSSFINITAIVGENGSGKTTLLQSIFKNSKSGVLMIFEDDDNSIVISNDIGPIEVIYNGIGSHPIHREDVKYMQRTDPRGQHIVSNSHKHMSYVYLTNSIYSDESFGYTKDISIDRLILTPNTISKISEDYFYNIKSVISSDKFKNFHSVNHFNVLFSPTSINNSVHFQALCTIEYYYFIMHQRLDTNYIGKILQDISIKAMKPKINTQPLIDADPVAEKSNEYTVASNIYDLCKKLDDIQNQSIILLCSLIIELSDFLEEPCKPEINISDFNILKLEANRLLKIFNTRYIDNVNNDYINNMEIYYSSALTVIEQIHNIELEVNFVSEDNDFFTLSYTNKRIYNNFIEIIHNCIFSENHLNTFLLTHLSIKQNTLSAGEYAMQNFFSWLHMLNWFGKIDQMTINGLKNNILLLIDEIDLYAHPEWQRCLISQLLEHLNKQFCNRNIQVIFTTHSPLVLSDMLSNNIIYLEKGKLTRPNEYIETFSNELYSLLNNSFFLKNGVIGEFAKHKIQSIINSLTLNNKESKLSNEELHEMNIQISVIGDSILRNKLFEMLDDYINHNNILNYDTKKDIDALHERIKYLEEYNNDTNKI